MDLEFALKLQGDSRFHTASRLVTELSEMDNVRYSADKFHVDPRSFSLYDRARESEGLIVSGNFIWDDLVFLRGYWDIKEN
jgi:hypothetical protein